MIAFARAAQARVPETMKAKALLVLALAAAVGGPAWCQDFSQDPDSDPSGRSSGVFPSRRGSDFGQFGDERSGATRYGEDATSPDGAGWELYSGVGPYPEASQGADRQRPPAPGALPYPELPTPYPYEDGQARSLEGNGGPGGGASFGKDKTLKPTDDLSLPSYGGIRGRPVRREPPPGRAFRRSPAEIR